AVEARSVQFDIAAVQNAAHAARSPAAYRHHGELLVRSVVQDARKLFGGLGSLLRHHHFASRASPERPARWTVLREGSGKILPGFMIPAGSKASFTRCIASRSSG